MLSIEQINQIFKFCEKHFVHYYDVQVELVDHLANAIEEKMQEDKHLSFETALNSTHASFGVMGFSSVMSEKSAALEKRYAKLKWKYFKEYFTLPKISLTILLFAVLSALYLFINTRYLYYCIIFVFGIVYVNELFIRIFLYKIIKRQIKKDKKLLSLNIGVFNYSGILGLGYILFSAIFNNPLVEYMYFVVNPYLYFVVVAIIVLIFIYSKAIFKMQEKILADAKMQYPLAFR